MSALSRRLGLLVAVVAVVAGLSVAAPRANAAPDTGVRQVGPESAAVALARQVAMRQNVLSALDRQADARDRELIGLRDALQEYGFTGDSDDVRVILPLASYHLSAGFGQTGPLWEAEHGGQDFGATAGEPIVAIADGEVTEVGEAGPYGLRTILTLEDGTEIWFCHQTSALVDTGDIVRLADEIGTVGSTGNSTGPHLHLEVRPDGGNPIDPLDWLRAAGLNP